MGVALPAFLLAMYEKDGLRWKGGEECDPGPFPRPGVRPIGQKISMPRSPRACEKGGCDCKRQKKPTARARRAERKGKTGRPCPPSR